MCVCWSEPEGGLASLAFARSSPQLASRVALRRLPPQWAAGEVGRAGAPPAIDSLIERLEAFAAGRQPGDFRDVPLELQDRSDFQRRVLLACQAIDPGSTVTYGELARRADAPRAARAVGGVMASNRVPLVVPCHRVIASDGSLRGFSAPQGLRMKRRLLRLEA